MYNTDAMTDFEVKNFEEDVLKASYQMPVVVDFWAPWCGPCRMLGPVLEQLARESGGKWKLVKVNTEVHPELAMQFGVRGIPNVKLFKHGQVVDEFTGALPAPAVKRWLEKHLPSEEKELLQRVEKQLQAGYVDRALQMLEDLLTRYPQNVDARLLKARILLFEQPEEAEALLQHTTTENVQQLDIKESLLTLARLLKLKDHPETLPEDPVKPLYLSAIQALAEGDFDRALEQFIQVIQRNRYYDDDSSRKAALAIFRLLGEEHPITRKHRRIFDMSLY